MNRIILSSIIALGVSHITAEAESIPTHQAGDVAVEASIGLAAGYGLFGGAVHIALTDSTDIGISGGVDIYNTHLGLRATTYFGGVNWIPLAYAAASRSQFESEQSWYASAGAGLEYRSSFGLYWQGNIGYSAYVAGHAGDGNGPGFVEARPLTVGYRF